MGGLNNLKCPYNIKTIFVTTTSLQSGAKIMRLLYFLLFLKFLPSSVDNVEKQNWATQGLRHIHNIVEIALLSLSFLTE